MSGVVRGGAVGGVTDCSALVLIKTTLPQQQRGAATWGVYERKGEEEEKWEE